MARVLAAERREITRRSDGGRRPVLSGVLADGTASVRFTWWDPPSEPIARGDVLRAVNAQVREYQGRVELSFSWRTRVAPAREAELPTTRSEELTTRPLRELRPGEEGFRVEGRVVRVAGKTVSVGAERRLLHEGVLADGSGVVAFTAWSDFGLKVDETLEILGGYVREFRGRPQLSLDERSSVRRTTVTTLPTIAAILGRARRTIAEVEVAGGGELLEVRGVVVGVLPPSGIVLRCPECRRSVRQGSCRIHGAVSGEPDLRARLVLDDGTGTLTVHAERADTERLWGRSLEEAVAALALDPDPSPLDDALFRSVFGRYLRVRGSGWADGFGVTVEPESIEVEGVAPADSVALAHPPDGGR
ncbi:MAG TPA: hypothetical protein VJQ43_02000 [Thermoplasmata archaeon]|nr:hypothetical protein [Thermoplasmata archaeon]